MATLGAFFDANVLYPAGLRNFLMYVALTGIFRAPWSAEVHEEWILNLLKNRLDITRDKLERTRRLMEQALPDAMVLPVLRARGVRQRAPTSTTRCWHLPRQFFSKVYEPTVGTVGTDER